MEKTENSPKWGTANSKAPEKPYVAIYFTLILKQVLYDIALIDYCNDHFMIIHWASYTFGYSRGNNLLANINSGINQQIFIDYMLYTQA